MALNHPGSHREGPTVGPSPNYRPFTFSILITGLWGFCLNTDFWRYKPIWGKRPLTQTIEFLLLECSTSLTFILVFFFLKIDSMPWAEPARHLATMFVDRKYLNGWFTALQSFWLKRLFLKRLVKISPWTGLFKAAKVWTSLVSFIVDMIWFGGRWGAAEREKET